MNPDFMKQLWVGYKPIDWLDVSVTDNIFKYPPSIQEQVQDARSDIYTQEIAKGKKIRDSDLYRVHAMDISDEQCCLELGLMKWSEHHIMKKYEHLWEQLMPDQYPNGIACSALIETNDWYYIFGERSQNYGTRIWWAVAMIGGTLQPDEWKVFSYIWFYDHILRELYEEIGIKDQYVYDSNIVGIQRMQNGGIAFVYYLRLQISSDEVQYMFDTNSDDEFRAIQMIHKDKVINFLYTLCYKNWILHRTLWLNIDYIKEITKHTTVYEKHQDILDKHYNSQSKINLFGWILDFLGWFKR